MKLSKLSDDFKNKSLNLFAINVLILSILPVIFYFVLGYFSGFGFYIINAQLILNFQKITLYILALGLLIPISILFATLFTGLDRNRISNTFPLLTNFVIYGLLFYLTAGIIIFIFCFFLFLNELLGLKVIFMVIGAALSLAFFYIFPPLVKGVFNFTKINYVPIVGVSLNKKDHSKIFSVVSDLSKKINAKMPKNIVLGLSTDFFAISKDLKVFNGINQTTLKNETLYISIPYLRILTIKELEGIIGHELGHFEGDDTIYAMKFAPIFRRLNQHFLELDEEFEDQKKELKSDPILIKLAIYPFIFLFNEFSRKEERISKEQELKADKFGADASESSDVFITALSKLYIYDLVWEDTKNKFKEIVREKIKNKIKNLSLEFVRTARLLLEKDKLKVYLKNLQFYEQLHPSDTHPPLEDRMKNLGVKMEKISNKSLVNFLPSSASLIPNIDLIEENLTVVLNEIEKFQNES
ncbi:M48 family metalloprotease [Candidatus Pelagibacter sp.]|uniref:M48 family metallopeptidase n=1 Tax=Candidatus Pelagibacter sp. TaxID=2024849 RepID=UPI003F82AF58